MLWTVLMRWYILINMKNQQAGNQKRQRKAASIWTERKPEIERLYVNGTWSQMDLAKHYGMSQQGIARALRRMGIPTKPRSRAGKQNGRFKDGTQSTMYRQMIDKDCCNKCGETENLVIHHKDGVHTNNKPDNLEVLCSPCHTGHHKQAWWDARKSA